MSKNFELIINTAKKLGLKVDVVPYQREFCTISDDKKTITVAETFNLKKNDYSEGTKLAKDKFVTNYFLKKNGLSIPKTIYFKKYSDYKNKKNNLNYPLVLKGNRGSRSQSIFPNITSKEELEEILFSEKMNDILIQEMVFGNEYRILTLDKTILGVLHFKPPYVIGDGSTTIKDLIDQKNIKLKKKGRPIIINDKVKNTLSKDGFSVQSVPKDEQVVYLQKNSSLSEGGESIECTDIISESVAKLAIKAAQSINLSLAGIDFICEDISKEVHEQKYFILEINSRPSLSIHDNPDIGKGINPAKIILKKIFDL